MIEHPDTHQIFDAMSQGLQPEAMPGYLQYWETRATNAPEDERVGRIVSGLTHVALRGEAGTAEYTNRSPAYQARYWYRSLGPLNPLTGVEPDMVQAARLMYGENNGRTSENDNLQLDSAHIMFDLSRVTQRDQTKRDALRLGMQRVSDIKGRADFDALPADYRIQTFILENDLRQSALRLKHTGTLEPLPMKIDTYREYEKDVAAEDVRAMTEFGRLVKEKITDENFGVLFEWYLILARRHQAWKDEQLDTVTVRGATSRENAEWTGEDDVDPKRVAGNFDVLSTLRQPSGDVVVKRYQLKTVKESARRMYHPRVSVVDFADVMGQKFTNIDAATSLLVRNLVKFRNDYEDR